MATFAYRDWFVGCRNSWRFIMYSVRLEREAYVR